MDKERVVYERYKRASKQVEKSLCCPVTYSDKYLKIIPQEIIEKDYGCGDPSQYVIEGETVLDLGSGGGKLCFILAQVVGKNGWVIGVDMNSDMLSLARKYENEVAKKLGYKNFEFKRGRIQNLKLDLEKLDAYIRLHPINTLDDYLELEFKIKELEEEEPLIKDKTVDVVVSNCVLNLIRDEDKKQLFREIFRVLKDDGRAVISDIVSDKEVPDYMKNDPELWSGCISGAMKEEHFIKAFKEAGFKTVRILKKDSQPWRTIDGINFYSITVSAFKSSEKLKYKSCCGKSFIDLSFQEKVKSMGYVLKKDEIKTVQINVGGLCNQSCTHCHISAGPDDNRIMNKEVMEKILSLIKDSTVNTIDITGGAPELNPYIDFLIESSKRIVPKIIFRTNLTALFNNDWLITLLRDKRISLFASLPSIYKEELDLQRGYGVYEKSIKMLKRLNEFGFGKEYELNIVYNPVLPQLPDQSMLSVFEKTLKNEFNIQYNNLIMITNTPIGKYEKFLKESGNYEDYMSLLKVSFNEKNLEKLMCRNLINVDYDGNIYDCDFNNALRLKIAHVNKLKSLKQLVNKKIVTKEHCYACTAQKGSSCFGSLCC
jgi:arsenite methyltransferase